MPPPLSLLELSLPFVILNPSIVTADVPDISKQRDVLLPLIVVLEAPFFDKKWGNFLGRLSVLRRFGQIAPFSGKKSKVV